MGITDDLKRVASNFGIELFVEMNKDRIISTLFEALRQYSPGDIAVLIEHEEPLLLPPKGLDIIRKYRGYFEDLPAERFFEWLAEVRPDLAEVIVSYNNKGADFIVRTRLSAIAMADADAEAESEVPPEDIPATPPPPALKHAEVKPPSQFNKLTCEACGEEWVLPKEEALCVKACPFCGEPAKEETE